MNGFVTELAITNWVAYSASAVYRAVITESGGDQTLTLYVDNVSRLSTGTIDDVWSSGQAGFCVNTGNSSQAFDDVKIGIDNNADGDIDDGGDDIQIDDNFNDGSPNWNVMSLVYDNNGNLTNDGVFKYTYDGWNRLVKATRREDALTTVATYAWDGLMRRLSKTVTNCGAEEIAGDGGNTTIHYYYDNQWRILETRNGSDQSTRQWVWGTQYIDEPIIMDVNADPTDTNDCDPDETAGGEGDSDTRYTYHQDRNFNVTALTNAVGLVAERYLYTTPYGEFIALAGVDNGLEAGSPAAVSALGNPFTHQGLHFDVEKGSWQNRNREFVAALGRFAQRDFHPFTDGMNSYNFVGNRATQFTDPLGLWTYGLEHEGASGPGPIQNPPSRKPPPDFTGGTGGTGGTGETGETGETGGTGGTGGTQPPPAQNEYPGWCCNQSLDGGLMYIFPENPDADGKYRYKILPPGDCAECDGSFTCHGRDGARPGPCGPGQIYKIRGRCTLIWNGRDDVCTEVCISPFEIGQALDGGCTNANEWNWDGNWPPLP